MPSETVTPGVYEHYKGGRYTVLMVIKDSTNARMTDDGKPDVVVYVSLTNGSVWCRDLAEFIEPVAWSDGSTRPRFRKAED